MLKTYSFIFFLILISKECMGSPVTQNKSIITAEVVSFKKHVNIRWLAKLKVLECHTTSKLNGNKIDPEFTLGKVYEFNVSQAIPIENGSHIKGETSNTGPLPRELVNVKLKLTVSKIFPHIKDHGLIMVDNALKNYGTIGQVPGAEKDQSRGIELYLKDHHVKIEEHDKDFHISIFPKKGLWEFTANINKASGKLENPILGTIAPEPEVP